MEKQQQERYKKPKFNLLDYLFSVAVLAITGIWAYMLVVLIRLLWQVLWS